MFTLSYSFRFTHRAVTAQRQATNWHTRMPMSTKPATMSVKSSRSQTEPVHVGWKRDIWETIVEIEQMSEHSCHIFWKSWSPISLIYAWYDSTRRVRSAGTAGADRDASAPDYSAGKFYIRVRLEVFRRGWQFRDLISLFRTLAHLSDRRESVPNGESASSNCQPCYSALFFQSRNVMQRWRFCIAFLYSSRLCFTPCSKPMYLLKM